MSFFSVLCSSIVAGFFSGILTYPIETIKIRQQISKGDTGFFSQIKTMWKEGRILSFYSGVVYHIIGEIMKTVWRLGLFEAVKSAFIKLFLSPGSKPKSFDNIVISIVAATGETFFVVQPWDRLKIMSVGGSSPMVVLKSIFHSKGLKGAFLSLYHGFFMSLLRQCATNMFTFTCYYWLKSLVETPTWLHNLLFGGIAGAFASLFTMPLDTLKSIEQNDASLGAPPSIWETVKKNYEKGGIRAFFKGSGTRVLLLFCKRATMFYFYEMTLYFFPFNP